MSSLLIILVRFIKDILCVGLTECFILEEEEKMREREEEAEKGTVTHGASPS